MSVEVDDYIEVEKCIKKQMKQYELRKYGEIYNVNYNILKSVINDCIKNN